MRKRKRRSRSAKRRISRDMLTVQLSWINWGNLRYDGLYRSSNSSIVLTAVTTNLRCDSLYRSSNSCKGLTAVTVFTARGSTN